MVSRENEYRKKKLKESRGKNICFAKFYSLNRYLDKYPL